jgi:membrane-associated HD superfamily phosphohydrolase
LKEYNETSIRGLVEKIIDTQLDEGCFKLSPLTFRDIQTVKEVFVDKLLTVYHTRIAYPELKQPVPQKQPE